MSVNIVQNGELIPIAGKTVPAPTPDYVDAQYSSSTTYSKGMTCISGNKRYRYINSTASSGHQPPNATYWEEASVADEISQIDSETLLYTMTNQMDGSTVVTQDVQNLSIDTSPYKKLLLEIILLNASDKPYYLVCNVYFCLDHFLGTVAEASGAPQINVSSPSNNENTGFVSFQNTSNPRIITRVHLNSKWSTLTNKMQMKVYGIK